MDLSTGATDNSPDHSTCYHCKTAITWDEYTYVHDNTGFADCGVRILGGTKTLSGLIINPDIASDFTTIAEPITWFNEDGSRKVG